VLEAEGYERRATYGPGLDFDGSAVPQPLARSTVASRRPVVVP